MNTQPKLWGVLVQGPGSMIAQPDLETAEARAVFWSQWADVSYARLQMRDPSPHWPRITCMAVEWPWGAETHASDLAEHGRARRNTGGHMTDLHLHLAQLGYPDVWGAQIESEHLRRMRVHSEWQRANRSRVRGYVQRWRAKNPDKVRAIRREGMRLLRARWCGEVDV